MKTTTLPVTVPQWILLDASGQSLGRVAAKAAHVLRGKHKRSFSPHQPCGDQVIIVNASKLTIPAAKFYRNAYHKHTGYLGHMKTLTLKQMLEKDPTSIVTHAVKGMLARNRLKPILLKRLHVFPGGEHPYAAQKPTPSSIA